MSVFSRNINVSRVLQGNSWREVCPSRVNRRIGNPTYGGVRAGGREAPGYSLCARHGAKRQAWRTIVRLKTGAWPTRVDARVKRVGALVLATITGKQKRTGK